MPWQTLQGIWRDKLFRESFLVVDENGSVNPKPRTAKGTDPNSDSQPQDLGFGSVVSDHSSHRLLNRDGSFNVRRKGLGFLESASAYHFLLEVTWPRFILLVTVAYVLANSVFAGAYMLLGEASFPGLSAEGVGTGFSAYFYFSVHTIATIGYGTVVPSGSAANALVAIEALVGLLGFGLAAGVMFARVAQPRARILFSEHAIVAPYHGITALEFRVVNGRKSQIADLNARVVLSIKTGDGGERVYHELPLERRHVHFFPLAWTVVHPIDAESPLHDLEEADLLERDAEFLILLSGFEETFSQTVHSRSSYRADEVLWNHRFAEMFERGTHGEVLAVDIGRLSETKALEDG
jgi:inward rectifier potassium channel